MKSQHSTVLNNLEQISLNMDNSQALDVSAQLCQLDFSDPLIVHKVDNLAFKNIKAQIQTYLKLAVADEVTFKHRISLLEQCIAITTNSHVRYMCRNIMEKSKQVRFLKKVHDNEARKIDQKAKNFNNLDTQQDPEYIPSFKQVWQNPAKFGIKNTFLLNFDLEEIFKSQNINIQLVQKQISQSSQLTPSKKQNQNNPLSLKKTQSIEILKEHTKTISDDNPIHPSFCDRLSQIDFESKSLPDDITQLAKDFFYKQGTVNVQLVSLDKLAFNKIQQRLESCIEKSNHPLTKKVLNDIIECAGEKRSKERSVQSISAKSSKNAELKQEIRNTRPFCNRLIQIDFGKISSPNEIDQLAQDFLPKRDEVDSELLSLDELTFKEMIRLLQCCVQYAKHPFTKRDAKSDRMKKKLKKQQQPSSSLKQGNNQKIELTKLPAKPIKSVQQPKNITKLKISETKSNSFFKKIIGWPSRFFSYTQEKKKMKYIEVMESQMYEENTSFLDTVEDDF